MLKFPRFILPLALVYLSFCAFVVANHKDGGAKPHAYLLPGINAIETIYNKTSSTGLSRSDSELAGSKSKQYLSDIRAKIERYKSGVLSRDMAEKAWQQ